MGCSGCTSTQNITHSAFVYGVRCVKPPLKKFITPFQKKDIKSSFYMNVLLSKLSLFLM